MTDSPEDERSSGTKPDSAIRNPNISTETQPEGAAGRPSDTLDREPARDPDSGAPVPSSGGR